MLNVLSDDLGKTANRSVKTAQQQHSFVSVVTNIHVRRSENKKKNYGKSQRTFEPINIENKFSCERELFQSAKPCILFSISAFLFEQHLKH